MRTTILAFGEMLWDFLPSGRILGGAPFNFAYRVNSLGDRGLVVSRLGRDNLGREAFEQAEHLGLAMGLIQWDADHPTGTVEVSLDHRSNPDFFIVPNAAYDFIETAPELLEEAAGADCICFGTLVQRSEQARRALMQVLEAGERALKLLDINLRKDCYSKKTVTSSLEAAGILRLNDDEAKVLSEMLGVTADTVPDFCDAMLERWSLSHCLVTLGDRGAFCASREDGKVYVPGYSVRVVDTCGSGDAFTAGFAHGLLEGETLAECSALGCILGAMVASQAGATAPISSEDVNRLQAVKRNRRIEPGLASFARD